MPDYLGAFLALTGDLSMLLTLRCDSVSALKALAALSSPLSQPLKTACQKQTIRDGNVTKLTAKQAEVP